MSSIKSKPEASRRSVWFPRDLYEEVKRKAEANARSANQEIIYLIARGLQAEVNSADPMSAYGKKEESEDVVSSRKKLFSRGK